MICILIYFFKFQNTVELRHVIADEYAEDSSDEEVWMVILFELFFYYTVKLYFITFNCKMVNNILVLPLAILSYFALMYLNAFNVASKCYSYFVVDFIIT